MVISCQLWYEPSERRCPSAFSESAEAETDEAAETAEATEMADVAFIFSLHSITEIVMNIVHVIQYKCYHELNTKFRWYSPSGAMTSLSKNPANSS